MVTAPAYVLAFLWFVGGLTLGYALGARERSR